MRLCRIRLRKIKPERPAGRSIKPIKTEKNEAKEHAKIRKITMAKIEKVDEHKILTDFGLNRHLTKQERQMLNAETKQVLMEKGHERYLKFYEVDMLCRKHNLSENDRLAKLRKIARETPDTVTLPDGTRFQAKKILGQYGSGVFDIMIYDSFQDIAYQRLQGAGKLPIRPPISMKKHPIENNLKYAERIIMAPISNILWNPVVFYNDPEYEYTIQARYWSHKVANKEFLIHKKTLAFILIMILMIPIWFLEDILVSKDPNSWYRKYFYGKTFIDMAINQEAKLQENMGYTKHGLNYIGLLGGSPLNPINVKELEIDPDNPGLRRFPIDAMKFYDRMFIYYNRNISLDQATRIARFGERSDHNRRLLVAYDAMKDILANEELNFIERYQLSTAIKRIEEHLPDSSCTLEEIDEKLKEQDKKARRVPSSKSKLMAASTIPFLIGGGLGAMSLKKAKSMVDQTANQLVDWKVSWSPITSMNNMRTLSIRDQAMIKMVKRYPKLVELYGISWTLPICIALIFHHHNLPTKYIRDGWFEYESTNLNRDWISYTTTDKDLEYWWAELNRNEFVKLDDVYSSDDYLYFYDQGGPVLKSKQIHDHYKGHKDWFKLINNQEWIANGKYKDINSIDCPVSEEK